MDFVNMLINIIIVGVISGFVIWVVGKLKLGLTVDGFMPAFIAAFVIAIVGGVLVWLFGLVGLDPGSFGGFWAGVVNLIIAAIVLMLSGAIIPGMTVNGMKGALIGAVSIGIVAWIVGIFI